jgi:hypothetical protein
MRQINIPWVGALVESLFNALPFLSIMISTFNFFSIVVVLYSNIKPYIGEYVPNITLPVFMACIAIVLFVIMGLGMVLIYKYVNPSLWTFRNKQMNKYESEIMTKLIAIENELKELKKNV